MVAAVLDLQLKKLPGIPDNIRSIAYSHVRQLAATVTRSQQSSTAETEELPSKRQRTNLQDNNRTAVVQFLNAASNNDVANDFDTYLSTTVDRKAPVDVLQWWQTHKDSFPGIAAVACKYLAIPATSTDTERLFPQLAISSLSCVVVCYQKQQRLWCS